MMRLPGRQVSLEMAMLGLVEFALSFLVIYGMLVLSGAVATATIAPGVKAAHMAAFDAVNLAVMLSVAVILAAAAIGLYRPEVCAERRRLLVNAGAAGLLAFPAVLAVGGGFAIPVSRHVLVLLSEILAGWLVCIVASRVAFNRVMRNRWFIRRVLVIGSEPAIARMQRLGSEGRGRLFDQVPAGDHLEEDAKPTLSLEALRRQRIWGIVLADAAEPALPIAALVDCKLRGIPVFDEASFSEQHLGRIDLAIVKPEWLLLADGFASSRVGNAVKRMIDIGVSLALLLLTLPLMLLIALLVRLDSPGPILYRQERVGLYGVPFTLLKFRSMTADAEKAGGPTWAKKQDARITRVGGFIRRLRIDELPQVINILLGHMSMIGPRPERPQFVEQLAAAIPHYKERHYVRPGLTGWAQVNYPYGASIEDARQKLSYDLYYVKNRNLLLDMLILLATIRVILFGEGVR
ncbi:MAG TPA: TIGR03013 family XrtA/PEP-CTERM system glycosyltransferase [Acetobacteraceae bacterium]|nr:TIGR03013 family XrtA/PEP-CTERM system glycosyltransferase [Acetobacteraceae bacterium]